MLSRSSILCNHYAAVISSDGLVLTEPFKFSNDGDGFQRLSAELSDYAPESVIIGLESTAHYGDNLVRYLVANDYKVCVLNPIQTSSRRKNRIRKTKTDKVDAIVIAETTMMQKSYRFMTFYDLDLMDLKTLGRFRQKSIKQRTRLKIQLTSYVDQVFPELQCFFKSGLHQKSVYALLKEAHTPKIMKFNDSVIMTIPGIGYINGGMILGEIGDIHRFSKPNQLLAFAGLDPSVNESGTFNAKHTRMSKLVLVSISDSYCIILIKSILFILFIKKQCISRTTFGFTKNISFNVSIILE